MLITVLYIYFSWLLHDKQFRSPTRAEKTILGINLALTDLAFAFIVWRGYAQVYAYSLFSSATLMQFIKFVLVQDFYFYWAHRFMHTYGYSWHHIHHNYYAPFTAWLSHPIEHLLLNIGSLLLASFLFPLPLPIIIPLALLQTYTSPRGHAGRGIVHEIHHTHYMRRFGTGLYLTDRVLGTF